MEELLHMVMSEVLACIWPFFRLSGLFLAAPILNHYVIPIRIKVILLLLISFLITPLIVIPQTIELFSIGGLLLIGKEILIGISMGFVMQICFQICVIAGQLIAMQSGLGFAVMVDSANSNQVPIISNLYVILISLIFLAINGHLIIIQMLTDSFKILPIGSSFMFMISIGKILNYSVWMFAGGVLLALPAIIALLVVNICFAIMAKSAPQLNIFVIGFPITLILGVGIILLTLNVFAPELVKFIHHSTTVVGSLLTG